MLRGNIRELIMPNHDRLIAWVEPKGERECVAAFVSSATRSSRAPAIQRCFSVDEAKSWVEDQAAALGGIPVDWMDQPKAK